MATSIELDPTFRQTLRLLHSPSTDAAENIRKVLDDLIKQKHGTAKMLINTLNKKNLAEEVLATGSGLPLPPQLNQRRQSNKSSDSSGNNSNASPIQITTSSTILTTTGMEMAEMTEMAEMGEMAEMPLIISLSDAGDGNNEDNNIILDDTHLKDLEDLVCVVCRRIDLSAKNRLIECTKCNSLYHQDCHKPQISDSDLTDGEEDSWCCASCKNKTSKLTSQSVSSPAKSSSSHSSSSSLSSTNSMSISGSHTSKRGSDHHSTSSHSSGSNKSKSSSSHSKHHVSSRYERSSSSTGSKSSVTTPNINIISADKRIANMKKKAAKSHESKKKHKSSH